MADDDRDRPAALRIGDLLAGALKSRRLARPREDLLRDRRSLDLVEELVRAESEMKVQVVSALARSRDELERLLLSSLGDPKGLLPFSAAAAKAIELAERAAADMGHEYVADVHVLVGLLLVDEGPARKVLDELELGRADLYQAVALLDFPAQRNLKELMLSEKTTAFETLLSARYLSRGAEITTLHLLAALLANRRSSAVKMLRQQGVDIERLWSRIDDSLPG